IKADSLTQAVLDSGTVLTYIKITNTTTNTASIVNADKYMDIIFSVGNIGLYSYYNFTGLQFRYIIIPGGVRAGRLAAGVLQTYTKEQLRAMSYEEVMQLLERSKNE
ncbi:MAG: hypothetical protein ICV53_14545, partial [Flavisolibacter sp.]|nr:hypothetical protein [Flavisolibacter sp.]